MKNLHVFWLSDGKFISHLRICIFPLDISFFFKVNISHAGWDTLIKNKSG